MKESDLYPPLKTFLEGQGYRIKGEIGPCDVFAVRDPEPPLIVELKLNLNLTVLLQAVDRLAVTDTVYVGVPRGCSALKRQPKPVRRLFRRLSLGLIEIDPTAPSGGVKVLLDPGTFQPRHSARRRERLLREFEKRVGDPARGGSERRRGVMTAYRQRALEIARLLKSRGPTKAAEVARLTQNKEARAVMYRDVYGWFEPVSRGIYQLSPRGEREMEAWVE